MIRTQPQTNTSFSTRLLGSVLDISRICVGVRHRRGCLVECKQEVYAVQKDTIRLFETY